MKFCPACNHKYADDTLNFCLKDGVGLSTVSSSEHETIAMGPPRATGPTAFQPSGGSLTPAGQFGAEPKPKSRVWVWVVLILGVLMMFCGGGSVLLYTLIPETDDYVFDDNIFESKPPPGNTSPNETKPDKKTGKLRMENFEQLKNGMTYREAVEILGVEGDLISESGSGSFQSTVYMWRGDDFAVISVIFMNDKLFSKTKTGL
jgi:hypothetical protein